MVVTGEHWSWIWNKGTGLWLKFRLHNSRKDLKHKMHLIQLREISLSLSMILNKLNPLHNLSFILVLVLNIHQLNSILSSNISIKKHMNELKILNKELPIMSNKWYVGNLKVKQKKVKIKCCSKLLLMWKNIIMNSMI